MTIEEVIESIDYMVLVIRNNIISGTFDFIEEDYISMLNTVKKGLEELLE